MLKCWVCVYVCVCERESEMVLVYYFFSSRERGGAEVNAVGGTERGEEGEKRRRCPVEQHQLPNTHVFSFLLISESPNLQAGEGGGGGGGKMKHFWS